MKPMQLSRLTVLGLMSLSLFTLLFVSSIVVQGASSALAASHSPSLSPHSQALSATQTGGKSPFKPNGLPGTLNCRFPTLGPVTSSPTVVNGVIYVGSQDHFVYALNATTCALIWKFKTGGPVNSSPAVALGDVYIGSNDGKVYALKVSTGTQVCNYQTGGPVTSSPDVVGKHVYVGSQDHYVYALKIFSCNLIWKYLTAGPVLSSPAVVGGGGGSAGLVYIGSNDDKIYVLKTGNGALHCSFTTGGAVDSSPAVVNGVVYVGSMDGNVYAFNATTCASPPICNYTTGFPVELSPTVATVSGTPTIYVGSDGTYPGSSNNGFFYALNAATCALIWSYKPPAGPTRNWVIDRPVVATVNNVVTVYFGSLDHSVFALTASGLTLIWSYATGNYVDPSPAVVNGLVYIGSSDSNVYVLFG